ncbi:MAG: NADH-ubiquinone oxidoreductase-F iron-sulfur binding region domain-containing protein [Candidatus Omnitrophota bacterium]|nr:NADH-ubiquinone oxidoreductase-F iron-sulfur binding region domain-containing protein [Candidatus Omnitrophota bacterium]
MMHPLECRRILPQDLKALNSLSDYIAQGGGKAYARALSMSPLDVIGEIKKANLRGRGGAGFPTAIKWAGVRNEPCPTKYVVCNFSEGEPGTYKDRYLILKNPYHLFEGIAIAIYAIGAKEAYIGIKKKYKPQVHRLFAARLEMEEAGMLPKGLIKIHLGPDEYLFGEEKGLLESIDGRYPMPRNIPPYIQGINFQPDSLNPTCVNNVESFCQAVYIFKKGADDFKSVGSQDTPGTVICTVCGDIKRPGIYEVPAGTVTLKQLLYDIAGGPSGRFSLKAAFSGVASGVVTPERFGTPLDFGSLKKAGGGLGSAGFIVYDQSACMVQAALKFSNFLAKSSCGQCVPCNQGTAQITEYLKKVEFGHGSKDDLEAIFEISGRCTNQNRCFLPTQESLLIPSIINAFPSEFKAHIEGNRDPHERDLILPKLHEYDEDTRAFTYDDPVKFPL